MSTILVSVPGWDAGARSIATLEGDGSLAFTVGQSTAIVCGLNALDEGAGYREIDHGFVIQTGTYRIIEQGTFRSSVIIRRPDAEFRLVRTGTTVAYYVDDMLVQISTLPSIGPVFLDCSLYAYNDEITSVTLSTPEDATAEVALSPLLAMGLDDAAADLNFAEVVLSPLAITAEVNELLVNLSRLAVSMAVDGDEWVDAEAAVELSPLLALGIDAALGDVNFALAELLPLAVNTDADAFIPDINQGNINLSPLAVGMYIADEAFEPASADISLAPLVALGIDEDLGPDFNVGYAELTPLDAFPVMGAQIYISGTLPHWRLRSPWTGWADLRPPMPELRASGQALSAWGRLYPDLPTLRAYSGASIRLNPPLPELRGSATNPVIGRAYLEPPLPELRATALNGSLATGLLQPPLPTLLGYGGASIRLTPPLPELLGSITNPVIARVLLYPPLPELRATALNGTLATGLLQPPLPELRAGLGNHAYLRPVLPVLRIQVTADFTDAAPTTYVVNLNTGAVTEWTLAPIRKLVTAHGRLYGLDDAGALLQFDAEEDVGEPIPMSIRFAGNAFGDNRAKRVSDLYFVTRENDGLTLHLIQNETTYWSYPASPTRDHGMHKVNVGKGPVFDTMGMIVWNQDGGKLDLGGVEANLWPLSRKV